MKLTHVAPPGHHRRVKPSCAEHRRLEGLLGILLAWPNYLIDDVREE